MKTSVLRFVVACSVLAGSVVAVWLSKQPLPSASMRKTPGVVPDPSVPTQGDAVQTPEREIREVVSQAVQPDSRFDSVLEKLAAATASGDPAAVRRCLAELRAMLDSLPPTEASRAIRAFLEHGKDAPTNLELNVQAGGSLGDASSIRVFLLDYLGQVDLPAAAEVGKRILSTPTSADEWAVSLRNVANADGSEAGTVFIRSKIGEMIRHPAWKEKPSAGFLEAFDVIVYAGAYELAPNLAEMVRNKNRRDLGHAAFLTLDRLTIADPVAALRPLSDHPEWMNGREQTRANLFARANVRDGPQKQLLETYLLDPARSDLELHTFSGLYPSANFMISNNLLTLPATLDHAELVAGDRAALEVVQGWIGEARFAPIVPHLKLIRDRLSTFVQQASSTSPAPGSRAR